jgi:protein-tyrosine-phosphatase
VTTPVILFACTHNAGRSLAARVLLEHYAQGRVQALSAGSEPGSQLNPAVVAILTERGLDTSHEETKLLTSDIVQEADIVVTMGCGEACPVFLGKRYLDWELDDPAGQPIEVVRPIVDEIDMRVQDLLNEVLSTEN